MSILSELKELSGDEMVRHSIILSTAICPGVLTLQIFKPELLQTLPVVHSVLLAISLSLPLLLLVFCVLMLSDHLHFDGEPMTSTLGLPLSSLIVSMLEYTLLVTAYQNQWSFRAYVSIINAIILIGLAVFAVLIYQLGSKTIKDKSASDHKSDNPRISPPGLP